MRLSFGSRLTRAIDAAQTMRPGAASLCPKEDVRAKIARNLGHRGHEVQEKILTRNAEKVYGVKVSSPEREPA